MQATVSFNGETSFNLDIYVFVKCYGFRKHTGTQKAFSLDFITVMSFYHLYKGNNNKDGFYCKVVD